MARDDDLELEIVRGVNDDIVHPVWNFVPTDDPDEIAALPMPMVVVCDLGSVPRAQVLHDRAVPLVECQGEVMEADPRQRR